MSLHSSPKEEKTQKYLPIIKNLDELLLTEERCSLMAHLKGDEEEKHFYFVRKGLISSNQGVNGNLPPNHVKSRR